MRSRRGGRVGLLVVVATLVSAMPVVADGQDLRLLRVRFADPPSVRRGTLDAAHWLGGDVSVRAAVEVTGSPSVAGIPVRFFARSTDGVTASRVVMTDERGRASSTIALRLPLASQHVVTLACLAQETSVCTGAAQLNLRRRVDFGGTFLAGLTARTPTLVGDAAAFIASDLSTSVMGRVSADAYLADGLQLYAAVPVESHRRDVTAFARTAFGVRRVSPAGSVTGFGNSVGGIRFARRGLLVEAEFSGGMSGRDGVSSVRGTGPGLVVLGEGFNTLGASFQYSSQARRTFSTTDEARPVRAVILGGGLSHALPRRFDDGTEARRGLVGRVTGGIGIPSASGARVYVVWGGYYYRGSATIPVPQGPPVVTEPHDDAEAGLKVQWLRWRGVVRPSVVLGSNGLLDGEPSFTAMFGLEFLPIAWGRR